MKIGYDKGRKDQIMAAAESTMLELGTPAPDFALPDASGRIVSLANFDGHDALLVMFICNHCPFVKHVRDELARLGATISSAAPRSWPSVATTWRTLPTTVRRR